MSGHLRGGRCRRRAGPTDAVPPDGRGGGALVPDGASGADRQVGHGASGRAAARRSRLVRRRRRRFAGLQHGRVDREGPEPAAGPEAVAVRGRRSPAVQLRGGGRRRRDQRRPRRGAPVGRSTRQAATWGPTGRRNTGAATVWRASCWCGCDPSGSCQLSIWPTETTVGGSSRPRPESGCGARRRLPVRTPGVRRGRWARRPTDELAEGCDGHGEQHGDQEQVGQHEGVQHPHVDAVDRRHADEGPEGADDDGRRPEAADGRGCNARSRPRSRTRTTRWGRARRAPAG